MQKKYDDKLCVIADINAWFVDWARPYYETNVVLEQDKHPHEHEVCRLIKHAQNRLALSSMTNLRGS